MKSDRHKKILELIADNNIGTQEELADALNKAGYNVTQATVSRDIRALNLTKVTIDGVNQKYTTLSHSSPVPNEYKSAKGRLSFYGYGTEYSCYKDCSGYGNGGVCGTGCT